MNYTKGEWETHRDGVGNLQIFAERRQTGNVIAKIAGDNKANAHLIVAAPDMYEALKGLCSVYQIDVDSIIVNQDPEYWQRAIKALAKAEGKQ